MCLFGLPRAIWKYTSYVRLARKTLWMRLGNFFPKGEGECAYISVGVGGGKVP